MKRANYATKVNHDRRERNRNDIPEALFTVVQGGSAGPCGKTDISNAVKELGFHHSQLSGQRPKARAKQNQSETEESQAVEIARLKRELEEAIEELNIIKKGVTNFGKSCR